MLIQLTSKLSTLLRRESKKTTGLIIADPYSLQVELFYTFVS